MIRYFKMLKWGFNQTESAAVMLCSLAMSVFTLLVWLFFCVTIGFYTFQTLGFVLFFAPFVFYLNRKFREHERK
ncbi:MAG: hypothetical protein LPK02_07365 [Rhodobacterales bacterium]|nr:hypothetical protein [Rhodobacterales bacterium]